MQLFTLECKMQISERYWQKAVWKPKKNTNPSIFFLYFCFIIHNHLQLSIYPAATSWSSKRALSWESHKMKCIVIAIQCSLKLGGKHRRTKLYTRQPSRNTALVGYKNSFFEYAPSWAKKWLAVTTQLLLPYKNTTQTKAGKGLKPVIATLSGSRCRYR